MHARSAPLVHARDAAVTASGDVSAGAGDARDATLVDQRGERFRLRDLAGAPVVVTFVASRCSDACPIADAEFALLRERLRTPPDGPRTSRVRARLLTITLDPDYDTPFVFAHLARGFGAADTGWRFASGDPIAVRRVMRAFGVVAERGRSGVPDVHSAFVYVLDGRLRLARTLPLSTGFPSEAARVLAGLR